MERNKIMKNKTNNINITVVIDIDKFKQLRLLAKENYRTVNKQIAYMIEKQLDVEIQHNKKG
jgi:hypothetical protein